MKQFKKQFMYLAAVFALCVMAANGMRAQAATGYVPGNVYVNPETDAKGNYKSLMKKEMVTDEVSTVRVKYDEGDSIRNVKSSKSALNAVVTYEKADGKEYSYGEISMYASKAGKYTVSFDVYNKANVKRGSYKMAVQAVNTRSLVKKATFGKKTVVSQTASMKNGKKTTTSTYATKVSGKSGKLKITPNSQYKITGILVASVGTNGKFSYKKIKNGKNITLSKGYETATSRANSGISSKSAKKNTFIYVSYKNKFTGESVTYSVVSSRGRKEIKKVSKGVSGTVSTDYSRCPGATITLWQY